MSLVLARSSRPHERSFDVFFRNGAAHGFWRSQFIWITEWVRFRAEIICTTVIGWPFLIVVALLTVFHYSIIHAHSFHSEWVVGVPAFMALGATFTALF